MLDYRTHELYSSLKVISTNDDDNKQLLNSHMPFIFKVKNVDVFDNFWKAA